MKCLVKAMTKTNSRGFQYQSNTFPNINTAKLKEGIFVGPQIRELLEGEAIVESLTNTERAAWESFKWVCTNFLGRKKSLDFSDGNQELLNAAYKEMGCRISSLIVYFLHSHVGFFPESPCEVSDEQDEFFHQDIKSMEHPLSRFKERICDDRLLLYVVP
jgi:hypothetical protein